jgi:hypothetical protein
MNSTRIGRRSWTDEQLADAVASQHSWRGVLRALGLKATSAGSLRTARRHANRMGLDASHFTGQRRWSDQQLRLAVNAASSWAEVLEILDLTDNADLRARVKGHAARLGLDVAHLQEPGVHDVRTIAPVELARLRSAATAIAAAWFALHGYPCALPVEPTVYDLLVTMPDNVKRVQVKSTISRFPNGKWQVGIGRRPYTMDKSAGKTCYDPDDLDLFFIVDGAGGIYLIPSAVIAGRVQICLETYAAYRVGDASSLLC